jgi:hypothetical protein
MFGKVRRKRFSWSKSELQVLAETARRAFLADNPRLERKGCPDPLLLKDLAFRTIKKEKAMEVTLHLGQCSACFREVSDYLERFKETQRRFRLKMATAAVLLLAMGISFFAIEYFRNKHVLPEMIKVPPLAGTEPPRLEPPEPTPLPPQIARAEPPLPVVDYTVISPTRSVTPDPARPKKLILQRDRLRLRIHLPLGSEDGRYEVRLHRQSDKKAVMRKERKANRENRYTLTIEEDFGRFPTGSYLLAIFPPGYTGEVEGHSVELVDD